MKITLLLIYISIFMLFTSCGNDPNALTAINSESFPEQQVKLNLPEQTLVADSLLDTSSLNLSTEQKQLLDQLDEIISMTAQLRKSDSDSTWHTLIDKWSEFNAVHLLPDSLRKNLFPEVLQKWTQLNISLVKLSGEVRFGDALEKIWYDTNTARIPEKLLKSIIYTHVFDQFYINIIGSSAIDYLHTTGGNVRIIQETNYPKDNEMILKTECNDLRYMDVFIRIPWWALNPTVTHGNVKYVARPGEYCQISKKWKTGDAITVSLKN